MTVFDSIYIHPSKYRHFKASKILWMARYRCERCGKKGEIRVYYLEPDEEDYRRKLGKGLGIALCSRCNAARHAERPVIAPAKVVSKLRKRDACITSPLTSGAYRPLPEGVKDKRPGLLSV